MTFQEAGNRLIVSKVACLENLKKALMAHNEYNEKMKDPQFRVEQKALIDSVLSNIGH